MHACESQGIVDEIVDWSKLMINVNTDEDDDRDIVLEEDAMYEFIGLRAEDERREESRAETKGVALTSDAYFPCYYRLGANAEEKDAKEIIDMASKASVAEQQKQVQENVHYQLYKYVLING
ncbi:hypothetical protein ABZP36_033093 [Zizania latifolia]